MFLLGWHVDYWDYIGWKDPFARAAFTERQNRYAKVRKLKVKGTPQFFVDNEVIPWGKGERAKIPAKVDAAAARPAQLGMDASAKLTAGRVALRLRPKLLDADAPMPDGLGVVAVLFQRRAVTKCTAGENDGKTLTEYFNVVAAKSPLPLAAALREEATVTFESPEGVAAKNLGVAILVENAETLRTLDCWAVPVESSNGEPSRTE